MSDIVERAKYCRDSGSFDALHGELLAEAEQLHELIRRGLPYGDNFRTAYAAAARAELRRMAGMKPPASETTP